MYSLAPPLHSSASFLLSLLYVCDVVYELMKKQKCHPENTPIFVENEVLVLIMPGRIHDRAQTPISKVIDDEIKNTGLDDVIMSVSTGVVIAMAKTRCLIQLALEVASTNTDREVLHFSDVNSEGVGFLATTGLKNSAKYPYNLLT